MYLPKIYETFSGKFPEVLKDFKQLGQTCREAGPLDQKCQDLIKLGIAVGANSRGAVMSSTRKALEAVRPRLFKGSVLVFDELCDDIFPGETLALIETLDITGLRIQRYPMTARISYVVIE